MAKKAVYTVKSFAAEHGKLMDQQFSTHLFIGSLLLDLFIGCTEEERKEKRPVEINIWIFFPKTPLGCISDELKDTVCYTKCAEIVRTEANKKPFQIIEHLAYEIHSALKKQLPMHLEIAVQVGKVHSSLPDLKKGNRFMYFPRK